MKPEPNEEKLSKVLRDWKAESSLPPSFQAGVWRMIEAAQSGHAGTQSVWVVFRQWIGTALPRPAMATAYVAVLLTIGLTAGWVQAYQTNARVKGELGDRYVRVLDPYQASRN